MGTPSKWYKTYSDHVTGNDKLREKEDEIAKLRREVCEEKQEAERAKNKLDGFFESICERNVYAYDFDYPAAATISKYGGRYTEQTYRRPHAYNTEIFEFRLAVAPEVKRQLLSNETFLRDFLRYEIERGMRDILNGKCDREW